jgi:hypothetical protein
MGTGQSLGAGDGTCARRTTGYMLALWSGREEAGLPGGTGDMVRIARQSGMVDVVVIDANQLLAD